jgi:hypothetical protein
LRRQSSRLEIDIEVHEIERQCLEDSMCTRWLPTLNEIERPAWAEELSAISTARKQSRFIASLLAGEAEKLAAEKPRLNVILNHRPALTASLRGVL